VTLTASRGVGKADVERITTPKTGVGFPPRKRSARLWLPSLTPATNSDPILTLIRVIVRNRSGSMSLQASGVTPMYRVETGPPASPT